MRFNSYQSSKLYKDRVTFYLDRNFLKRTFDPVQLVLLFSYRLRLFPRKLKSKLLGPFQVKQVKPYRAVELEDPA